MVAGGKKEKGKGAVCDCATFLCSTAEVQRSGAGFGQPLSKQRFCLLELRCSLASGKSSGSTLADPELSLPGVGVLQGPGVCLHP